MTVVGTTTSSADALVRAGETNPDVVLVDIMLGSESGFDLARKLTTAPQTRQAAVILISTHGEDDFSDLIAASPAIGFLPKWRLSARAIQDLLGEPGGAVE
jgi:CheY-like chemotaxis protein